MKIIILNTWGSRSDKEFSDFLIKNQEVDVFCFQEILKGGNGRTSRGELKNSYEFTSKILTNHYGYFAKYPDGSYYGEDSSGLDFEFGLACFAKKIYKKSFINSVSLNDREQKWSDYTGRISVGTAMGIKVLDFIIINVHGIWQGGIKKDTEAKIEQSRRIIELVNKNEGRKIICGDLNLNSDTECIKMIENLPMRNLIKEYKITSTRTSLYTKNDRLADYVFVDNGIEIINFQVLPDEISDHAALELDIFSS